MAEAGACEEAYGGDLGERVILKCEVENSQSRAKGFRMQFCRYLQGQVYWAIADDLLLYSDCIQYKRNVFKQFTGASYRACRSPRVGNF